MARLFFIFWVRWNLFRDFSGSRRPIFKCFYIIRFAFPLAFQRRIPNCSTAKTHDATTKTKHKVENEGKGGERYDEISTPPPSLKLSHRLCIVPLGTSCKKSLFHKSAILAVKMTIYWISYEVQKESQENLWPIAIFFKFFLLKASVFKNSFRKKCTKRYNTDLIRVKSCHVRVQFPAQHRYIYSM